MNKRINGLRYDTKTAREMASYQYSYPSDHKWYSETLYKKNTGEFFLHGQGGPSSKYHEEIGRSARCEGEKIVPLSFENAKKWAEVHLDADEYGIIFYTAEEADVKEKSQISLWVTEEQKEMAENLKFSYAEIFAAGLKALGGKQ